MAPMTQAERERLLGGRWIPPENVISYEQLQEMFPGELPVDWTEQAIRRLGLSPERYTLVVDACWLAYRVVRM